jgi:hypothetical protein
MVLTYYSALKTLARHHAGVIIQDLIYTFLTNFLIAKINQEVISAVK